ncbi:hypothetical protein ACVWXS_005303 [Lysinibacillus sp. TE18511]
MVGSIFFAAIIVLNITFSKEYINSPIIEIYLDKMKTSILIHLFSKWRFCICY